MAATGEHGLHGAASSPSTQVNAKGGVLGQKLVVVPIDNKLSAQESLMQLKAAIDQGVRYIVQGNGSIGRRRADRRGQQAQRAQPRQDRGVPQLRRGRSGLHQRQVQLLALPLRRQQRHEDGGAHRRT